MHSHMQSKSSPVLGLKAIPESTEHKRILFSTVLIIRWCRVRLPGGPPEHRMTALPEMSMHPRLPFDAKALESLCQRHRIRTRAFRPAGRSDRRSAHRPRPQPLFQGRGRQRSCTPVCSLKTLSGSGTCWMPRRPSTGTSCCLPRACNSARVRSSVRPSHSEEPGAVLDWRGVDTELLHDIPIQSSYL